MFLLYTIFMIEPTQEFITKVVENHFDVSDREIGLVKMQFYFEDQDFKEKFVRLTQAVSYTHLTLPTILRV